MSDNNQVGVTTNSSLTAFSDIITRRTGLIQGQTSTSVSNVQSKKSGYITDSSRYTQAKGLTEISNQRFGKK